MPKIADGGLIVVGLLLIAGSRVFADAFRVSGDTSLFTKFAGLGDNDASRLYRWATAVVVGLVLIIAGVADLLSG
jgi:hypothetical protein